MKLFFHPIKYRGFALPLVLLFLAIGLMAVSSLLGWVSSSSLQVARNNQYFRTAAAAEAATEKVMARIARDFQLGGEAQVYSRLGGYLNLVPLSSEDSVWTGYKFANGLGGDDQTYVARINNVTYRELSSQYRGLRGFAGTYRIISNARQIDDVSFQNMTAAIKQDFELATIPLFQFAIFYTPDLEMNPGKNMNITGRVHSNADIYTQPNAATLTFLSDVTAAGNIIPTKKAGDPSTRSAGTVVYRAEHDGGVSTLNLPIGTNNTPQAVQAILEPPPSGEVASSLMGKQRYYNKADMLVLVTDSGVKVTSGIRNNFTTTIPQAEWNTFISTNRTFFNPREGKTVRATQIDVDRFNAWSRTESHISPGLGHKIGLIYVDDRRTQISTTESGVRLINGAQLPDAGLTVATPDPIYVQGDYNAPAADRGSTNTANTKPASLVADAITLLSNNWRDTNSNRSLSSRLASDTTVNAAFLGGIVPTENGNYSGGVENFPRYLEDWSGRTHTYNGSMVVMFYSQIARAPWGGNNVYVPPNRNWTFDLNFLDPTKLPPGTPSVTAIIRGSWAMVPPNTVNF